MPALQYEAAVRTARDRQLAESGWLQQMARPVRVSYSETSIKLSLDRGAKRGFRDGKVGGSALWRCGCGCLVVHMLLASSVCG